MELDQTKVISRVDIINTLKSRHLDIPDLENLTYEELLRIYKSYAVPLEKRSGRERFISFKYWDYVFDDTRIRESTIYTPVAQEIVETNNMMSQQGQHILQQAKYLKLSFNTISNQAPKRYHLHGQDISGGPTPPKRLMIQP